MPFPISTTAKTSSSTDMTVALLSASQVRQPDQRHDSPDPMAIVGIGIALEQIGRQQIGFRGGLLLKVILLQISQVDVRQIQARILPLAAFGKQLDGATQGRHSPVEGA